MKFSKAFPHVKEGEKVGRLENSGRVFPCIVCGTPTGWRDEKDPTFPGTPICSDECLDEFDRPKSDDEEVVPYKGTKRTAQETLAQPGSANSLGE